MPARRPGKRIAEVENNGARASRPMNDFFGSTGRHEDQFSSIVRVTVDFQDPIKRELPTRKYLWSREDVLHETISGGHRVFQDGKPRRGEGQLPVRCRSKVDCG